MPALSHADPYGVNREIAVTAAPPSGRRPSLIDLALLGDSLCRSPMVESNGTIRMVIRVPARLGSPWAEKVAASAARCALIGAGLLGWDVTVDVVPMVA